MRQLICFFLGGFVGFMWAIILISDHIGKDMNELKAQCESKLPRNQQCIMYFKPEER